MNTNYPNPVINTSKVCNESETAFVQEHEISFRFRWLHERVHHRFEWQIIFAEPANKTLSVYDSKGNFSSNIAVSTYPFDVTSINYYTFAVTYDKVCFIDTSKNTRSVQRYRTSYPCRGISYMSGHIYVVVETQGIQVMDITGNLQMTITIDVKGVHFFTSSNSRLYYANTDEGTIHCCDMRGKEIWKF